MNSNFPNSPEDKLLDELLREQSHGPDEAFLKHLEAAVDAGSPRVVKRPPAYGKFSIAAGLALAAGVGLWSYSENRKQSDQTLALLEAPSASLSTRERTMIVPDGDVRTKSRPVNEAEARRLPPGSVTSSNVAIPDSQPLDDLKSTTAPPPPVTGLPATGALFANGEGYGRGSGAGLGGAGAKDKALERITEAESMKRFGPIAPRQEADELVRERGLNRDWTSRGPSTGDSISSDRYGTFIDQPWKSPDKDPLSTFSIDVDTASYSNVRRMIVEGRQIPKDAVRIEECINAFSYNYAQPKGDGPFAVSATLAACPWEPSHQLVRVAIKGREIEANKRPASNLVFLVDVSGSMQSPDKLPLLKQSMATMVEQLDERDRVAIVVYAGTEGVALPSTRLDAAGKATVLKSLEKLEAGGSTNGGAGIKRAYELAMKEKIEGGVNRVILATDGDFNVGVTGQPALVELVKDRAKSGVYLTVVGFGTGNLNDAMMDAITHDGNGNYFYIDSEREGRKVFLQNLSGTLVTIAKDVKIQVEFNPAKVGNYRLIGYANRVLKNEDFNNDKVDAGDIGAGHTVTAFYELMPPGKGAGTDELKYQASAEKPAASAEWLTVKLRHKHPDGDESSKIEFPLTGEVQALDKTEPDFQFATAAALFGMKLRSMEEVGDFGWDKVIALATPGLANDATEDRAEFVGLLKKLDGTVKVLPEPAEVISDGPRPRVVPVPPMDR